MPSAIPTTQGGKLSDKIPKLVPRKRIDNEIAAEIPQAPALQSVPDLDDHVYFTPGRRILSRNDHELFLSSPTHELIVSFVFSLADSIRDTTITAVRCTSAANDATIVTLLHILDQADQLLKSCPPTDTGSRFGNPAFRTYLNSVQSNLQEWHTELGISGEARDEISVYLAQSFGNAERIDYGSGHELNFILWLLCLRQLSCIKQDTFQALALIVFPRYLRLMRGIQVAYYLEPAGSHGVWGLDDYQFLPFLFGASQLLHHKHIRPLSIHNQMIVEECAKDYLYLDQIQWVNATKTVQGLRWHSPMLDDISAAKSWTKVEGGMRKMFLAEVLGKLPVAQHFLFGSLIPATQAMLEDDHEEEEQLDEHGHVHNASSWGDCCGIKVPSAIGARQEISKHSDRTELRRLPFD